MLSAVLGGAALAAGGCGRGREAQPRLARAPMAGIACHVAGRICGRVGVAVWLTRPADAVTTRLLGRTTVLTTPNRGTGLYGHRRFWIGYLNRPPSAERPGSRVRLVVRVTSAGTTFSTTRSVVLSNGWG